MLALLVLTPLAAASPCGALETDLEAALTAGGDRCATTALHVARASDPACLAATLPAWGLTLPDGAPPAANLLPPPREKTTRDAEGDYPNVLETENFAIKWGSAVGFDEADVVALGDALEYAWSEQIDVLGYPTPTGADQYRFNVYIGDSGGGTPSSYGNAGYFWYDAEGHPMVVIAAREVGDPDAAALTAGHELFHAVQDAIGTYTYDHDGPGAWYFEATAVYMEEHLHPDLPDASRLVYGFLLRPDLPVNHFDYPDTASLPELHQYGAFLFVRHLDEQHGGPELIRRSFLEAPREGDPLLVLDTLLAEEGARVEDAFLAFTDRVATLDFPNGDFYLQHVEARGGWGITGASRPSGTIVRETDGWITADVGLPRTWGASYWELGRLPDGVAIGFRGEEGPARWHAALATRTGDVHQRWALELDGTEGALELPDLGPVDEAWLVVAAVDGVVDDGSSWSYAVEVRPLVEEEVDDEEEVPRSCGCGTAPSPMGGWVLVLALIRRGATRRRPSRSR